MALDFTALQTEVFARGFDYLNDAGAGLTRVKRWINDAMHQADELENWDYLFTSTTGTAPLTIADLRTVDSVVDVASLNPLMQLDRHSLVDAYADLTLTGQATYWYRTSPTTIAVYPVSTATLTVRYWRFGPDLSAGTDAPLMPDRFRPVIVELAVAKANRDSNNYDAANDCLAEAQRIIDSMRQAMLLAPDYVVNTGSSIDD